MLNNLSIHKTTLDGVLLITPPTVHHDQRGTYIETWNQDMYRMAAIQNGLPLIDWVQDDVSVSSRYVLRGIHGDQTTWKLITCLYGRIFLVVVNNDPDSLQYRKSLGIRLVFETPLQVLVPPKFGVGHLVLSDYAVFGYKQSSYYDRAGQFTLTWNDPTLGIQWPLPVGVIPITSERDRGV